jgi:hypothetical protein
MRRLSHRRGRPGTAPRHRNVARLGRAAGRKARTSESVGTSLRFNLAPEDDVRCPGPAGQDRAVRLAGEEATVPANPAPGTPTIVIWPSWMQRPSPMRNAAERQRWTDLNRKPTRPNFQAIPCPDERSLKFAPAGCHHSPDVPLAPRGISGAEVLYASSQWGVKLAYFPLDRNDAMRVLESVSLRYDIASGHGRRERCPGSRWLWPCWL